MKRLTLFAISFAASSLCGNEMSPAANAEQKLADAVAQLSAIRETITEEKVPLAAELRQLESALIEKRRERNRLERIQDNAGVELSAAEAQLKAHNDELTYVSNLLNDFASRLNTSLHPAELPIYSARIMKILNAGEDPEMSREEELRLQAEAIALSIERIEDNAGGKSFDGKAVLPDGKVASGRFALIGPVGIFSTSDQSAAGLVEPGRSLVEPSVVVFDNGATGALSEFVTTGRGNIPLDTTMGRATAIAATRESLIEHIQKGGIWMFPILAFAFLSTAIGILKLVELSRFKTLPSEVPHKVLEQLRRGNSAEATRIADEHGGPAADVLKEGVRHWRYPRELLDEVMFEKLLEIKPRLERGLSFISITAAVAPLLGLLGTVTGMINTFKLITLFGTGDAASLSGGISEALVTTEFGLVVAIPSLLLSAYLTRKSNGIIASMEQSSITFVNGVTALREEPEPEAIAVNA